MSKVKRTKEVAIKLDKGWRITFAWHLHGDLTKMRKTIDELNFDNPDHVECLRNFTHSIVAKHASDVEQEMFCMLVRDSIVRRGEVVFKNITGSEKSLLKLIA